MAVPSKGTPRGKSKYFYSGDAAEKIEMESAGKAPRRTPGFCDRVRPPSDFAPQSSVLPLQ